MTPALQFPQRIFPAGQTFAKYRLQNMLWYVAALSKYSLLLSRFILMEGAFFFARGALVVPRFNTLAYEGFTLLGETKFMAS